MKSLTRLRLLLAGDRLSRTLAGARVGVGALTADREALAVAEATVAAKVHQTLDIHGNFATKIAFHDVVAVDRLANLEDFGVRQLVNATVGRDADALADFLCELRADPMNVLKCDQNALLRRDIHTSYTSHVRLLEASLPPALRGDIYLLFNEKIRTKLIRANAAARTNPSVSSS
jgi:hypothetical protein